MSCPPVSSDVGDRDRIGPMLGQINIVFNFGAWFISHLSLEKYFILLWITGSRPSPRGFSSSAA